MNQDMTIVFIGFDGYSDMWDDCMNLFHRFWKDCPYPVMFVNNSKAVEYENVEVLHAGDDAEWSRKVQLAVERADTPYICLLLEDFFVGEKIDTDVIKDTLKLIAEDDIRYFKIVNNNRPLKNRDANYKGIKYLHVVPENDEYGVSLQAAIWKKDFLKEVLGTENYNAWKFEFDRVKEAEGKTGRPSKGVLVDDRNILKIKHGVMQSKYLPFTVKYFKKKGLDLNIQREVMGYPQYFRYWIVSAGKEILPKSWRVGVKHLLEKCGMKFVSTMRDKE